MRICTTVYGQTSEELLERAALAFSLGSDLVELRIDYLRDQEPDEKLKKYLSRGVVTCRSKDEGGMFQGNEEERVEVLERWLDLNPCYMDIELSLAEGVPSLAGAIRSRGSNLIVSWHDLKKTPPSGELVKALSRMMKHGGIGKIVTRAVEFSDNIRTLSLYRGVERGRLIAFCLGEEGRISRILCTRMGSPMTYSSLPGLSAASGQIPVNELRTLYDLISTQD